MLRFIILITVIFSTTSTLADSGSPQSLAYARVYTGEDGLTHFLDAKISLELKDLAPPAPPLALSSRIPASDIAFAVLDVGWNGDWHPAPRRQFALVLSGSLEIETEDGETRRFDAGGIFSVEDVTGRGHRSRVVGTDTTVVALVPTLE